MCYNLASFNTCMPKHLHAHAVVTGASEGIGEAYALEVKPSCPLTCTVILFEPSLQLAKQGMNVVLISNVEQRLHEVAEKISKSISHGLTRRNVSL